MIRKFVKRRAQRRMCRRLRARFQMIEPVPTQGLFNFRCFENVVEYVRLHPNRRFTVCEVIYIEDNEPVLHYLLRDEDTSKYLEVTLGWRADHLEFYLIRDLLPSDHKRIHTEFDRSLADWQDEFLPTFWRKLLFIERLL